LQHPQRFTLDLLNVILGEGMSSRLFLEVRDKLGLAYNIHSYLDHFQDSGALTVYAGVHPKKLEIGITAILEQLTGLKERSPRKNSIKPRNCPKDGFYCAWKDSRSVAGWVGGQGNSERQHYGCGRSGRVIDKVTAEDMCKLAKELLIGTNCVCQWSGRSNPRTTWKNC